MAIYTQEEQERLNRSLSLREQMVTEIFKDGVPTHTGTVRVVNELLNSIDSQIHNNANTRLKETEVNTGKETKDLIVQIMKNINNRMINTPKRENIESVELLETEIIEKPEFVVGEDSGYEEIKIDKFISKD